MSETREWPNPTPEMLKDPTFNAIWNVIKSWDINVPDAYSGYCGATGNHVRAILDALPASIRAADEALPALLDLAERASLPLAGDVDGLCARLEEHATDWNGVQMPDAEPAKGDPTAGALRQAASLIRSLAGRVEAEKRGQLNKTRNFNQTQKPS